MRHLAVVSPHAERLAAQIRPHLGPDRSLLPYTGDGDFPEGLVEADVALGAPDLLAPMLHQLPHLRWVQSTWAGITPFLDAPRRDYLLSGVKGIFGRSMAEYVLAWTLAIKRSVLRQAGAKQWDATPGTSLSGLHLGIAGVGSIGAEVAQRCAPFFAQVRGLNSDGRAVDGCDRCFPADAAVEFASGLHVLVLLLPHTSGTTRLIDAAVLEALSPGALLINAGRANALDHGAALARLEAGHLEAVVLDVLDREPLPTGDPLWRTPGVYISSHTSAPTELAAISDFFLANLQRYERGESPLGLIDFGRGY